MNIQSYCDQQIKSLQDASNSLKEDLTYAYKNRSRLIHPSSSSSLSRDRQLKASLITRVVATFIGGISLCSIGNSLAKGSLNFIAVKASFLSFSYELFKLHESISRRNSGHLPFIFHDSNKGTLALISCISLRILSAGVITFTLPHIVTSLATGALIPLLLQLTTVTIALDLRTISYNYQKESLPFIDETPEVENLVNETLLFKPIVNIVIGFLKRFNESES